jgi:hypothetical protein
LHDSALRLGLPPQKALPGLEGSDEVRYDVSPGGRYIAYNFSNQKVGTLCVFPMHNQKSNCIDDQFWQERMSVADTGEVLYEAIRVGGCYLKDSHFSTKSLPGYTWYVHCPDISYWRPGEGEPRIVEPFGAQPQWITPETASALTAWQARSHVAR